MHVAEAVETETREAADFVGAVGVPIRDELVVVLLGYYLLYQRKNLVAGIDGFVFKRANHAMDADDWLAVRTHMQIASHSMHQRLQVFVYLGHGVIPNFLLDPETPRRFVFQVEHFLFGSIARLFQCAVEQATAEDCVHGHPDTDTFVNFNVTPHRG